MAKGSGWIGKVLGGGIGWAVGGPLGGVLGMAIGSLFDAGQQEFDPENPNQQNRFQSQTRSPSGSGDFTASLLVLCAAVMKADGKVLVSELDYVKDFFKRQFGLQVAEDRVLLLRDLLKQDIPVKDVCAQIKQFMPHADRIQLLHLMFGVALADGHIHQAEVEEIKKISFWLGISQNDFESLLAMFRKSDPAAAYKILEAEPNASDEELKKAYRKMAIKYHPDKVAHLGEEYQKDANEMFKSVQQAWETIRKERNIN
jgi:DnaJ like chaperone protein